MRSQGVFARVGKTLVPVDKRADEIIVALKEGRQVLVNVHAPRNIRHHNKAWALAAIIGENADELQDADDAMDWLKIKARHVKWIVDPSTGSTLIVPKSIAFASLDQVHFSRLFDRFLYIVTTEIIPGLEEASLKKRIDEIIDGEMGKRYERGGR